MLEVEDNITNSIFEDPHTLENLRLACNFTTIVPNKNHRPGYYQVEIPEWDRPRVDYIFTARDKIKNYQVWFLNHTNGNYTKTKGRHDKKYFLAKKPPDIFLFCCTGRFDPQTLDEIKVLGKKISVDVIFLLYDKFTNQFWRVKDSRESYQIKDESLSDLKEAFNRSEPSNYQTINKCISLIKENTNIKCNRTSLERELTKYKVPKIRRATNGVLGVVPHYNINHNTFQIVQELYRQGRKKGNFTVAGVRKKLLENNGFTASHSTIEDWLSEFNVPSHLGITRGKKTLLYDTTSLEYNDMKYFLIKNRRLLKSKRLHTVSGILQILKPIIGVQLHYDTCKKRLIKFKVPSQKARVNGHSFTSVYDTKSNEFDFMTKSLTLDYAS